MINNDPNNLKESALIEDSKNGDLKAFESLIKPFESKLYNYLKKMCNNPDTAEDMLQNTLINIFSNLSSFRSESKFSTWAFRIASNNCLMNFRKHKNKQSISLDDQNTPHIHYEIADFSTNPEELYEKKELKEILDKALAKLPDKYRQVFILKDIEGFKAAEIADILDISLANVKARILRSRVQIQELLGSEFETVKKGATL